MAELKEQIGREKEVCKEIQEVDQVFQLQHQLEALKLSNKHAVDINFCNKRLITLPKPRWGHQRRPGWEESRHQVQQVCQRKSRGLAIWRL